METWVKEPAITGWCKDSTGRSMTSFASPHSITSMHRGMPETRGSMAREHFLAAIHNWWNIEGFSSQCTPIGLAPVPDCTPTPSLHEVWGLGLVWARFGLLSNLERVQLFVCTPRIISLTCLTTIHTVSENT